jgi:hypothetical protein
MLLANLSTLQQKFPAHKVSLSPITGSDMFYSDGLASGYMYRLNINEGPALKFSAYINTQEFASCSIMPKNDPYGNIVHEWLIGLPKESQPQAQPQPGR